MAILGLVLIGWNLHARILLLVTLFRDIDDMLFKLYYRYEKSPKKCRELSDLVDDLKEVFEFPEGGSLPMRAHGSRWITYKRLALQGVVDRFGAYLSHLATLIEDTSIKTTDWQVSF